MGNKYLDMVNIIVIFGIFLNLVLSVTGVAFFNFNGENILPMALLIFC